MEHLLLACICLISVTLSVILCFKILAWLRFVIPIYVNCWFCNKNYWIRFVQWNSWVCPGCEQYNGFDSEGNYNKSMNQCVNSASSKDSRRLLTPPRNGLCRICNINQHLKVTQLSNFTPVNRKKFDVEVEAYRLQLEKAYKLCIPCQKFVKVKLLKDKEKILGVNLRLSRSFYSLEKPRNSSTFTRMITAFLMTAACVSLLLSIYELHKLFDYEDIVKFINDFYTKANELAASFLVQHSDFFYEVSSSIPFSFKINELECMKFLDNVSFPNIEIPAGYNIGIGQIIVAEKAIGGIGSLLQLFLNLWTWEALSNGTILNLLWAISFSSSFIRTAGNMIVTIKFLSALLLVILYKNSAYFKLPKSAPIQSPLQTTKAKAKIQRANNGYCSSEESEDEVSLRKFGLESSPNSSRSLNESFSNMTSSVHNTNRFKVPNAWTHTNIPSHPSNTFSGYQYQNSSSRIPVPSKPSFNEYQSHNSDHSDLDEGLGGLNLGTEHRSNKRPGVFSLRKYNCSNPSVFRPVFTPRGRHLISPSRLMHGTQQSWVAGGYWGGEPTHNIFNTLGMSRSSSQSSGFESHHPSREDSECGDFDKTSVFNEPNEWNRANHFVPHYNIRAMSRMAIHPLMNYADHVHIPSLGNSQTHFYSTFGPNEFCAQQCGAQGKGTASHLSAFGHDQQSVTSSLIRLPQNP